MRSPPPPAAPRGGDCHDDPALDAVLDQLTGVPAELVACFTLAGDGRRWWHDRVAWRGDPRQLQELGQPYGRAFDRRWDPASPPPGQANVFHAGTEAPRRAHRGATELHTWAVLNPEALVAHQRRMLVYDADDTFVGWVGVWRAAPAFTEAEDAWFARRADAVRAAFIAAVRALDTATPPSGELLLGPEGAVRLVGGELGSWMLPARVAALAAPAGPRLAIGGLLAEARTLVPPEGGGPHTLWLLRRADRPRVHPLSRLGPRGREVAECVAAGATVAEVARHLGIGDQTVRDHLRRAYALFGIGSRAELARIVAGG